MYNIEIYEDKNGDSPIADYLEELNKKAKNSKEHRLRLKKIAEYIELLKSYGTRAGLPATKHLDGDIWELRPMNDRILFIYWKDNVFVLLHHFIKKTQKTPQREIDRAKRNLKDFLERSE
ncbi:type II toxin-antitoxin system RelE/ParE family toxin [Sedimentibacter sp.]|uniref:type II toxin-antitoxin system RelE/ParE family toxin n=1 Tax=Sedimentibacter sp. TaxID=1960295 RepID=UPI00289C6C57|nr:type II toxin-antitoxin system RelE/ParE family toxin [Sedimentibacter sp.]